MATTQRAIPSTTDEICFKYGTTTRYCLCPDFQKRHGGTYTDPDTHEAICKHIHHRRQQAEAMKAQALAHIDQLFGSVALTPSIPAEYRERDSFFKWLELA